MGGREIADSGSKWQEGLRPRILAGTAGVLALVFAASLFFLACGGEKKPTPFRVREPIPLGDSKLIVESSEVTSSYLRKSGFTQVMVFLTLKGFDISQKEPDITTIKNVITLFSLTLTDADGKKYQLTEIIPEGAYRAMVAGKAGDMQSAMFYMQRSKPAEDWVAIFTVPSTSHGYTLLITNPRFRKDQPWLAAVPLGR